jgi:plastocyanin
MLPVLRGVGTAVTLGLAACGGGDGAGTGPGGDVPPGEVVVGDNFFRPPQVTVVRAEGATTVTWRWTGLNQHNVTFDAGGANSATQTSGTFARTFTEAGIFTYICTIHGRAVMSGTVEVQ